MTTITFEMSEKALEIMQKTANIRKISLQAHIQGYFKFYEHCAIASPEKLAEYYKEEEKRQKIKEAKEYYAKYKGHRYILKKDGNKRIGIGWRACPIIENPESYDKELDIHKGEYYLEISYETVLNDKILSISNVNKREKEFYPTLKRLKKAVNRHFRQYNYGDYYKMRQKEN